MQTAKYFCNLFQLNGYNGTIMDIVSFGEIVVDMFPAEMGQRLEEVTAFYPKPGGASANVAVGAARLGKQSAFIGKVGKDAFGKFMVNSLQENGVETSGIRLDTKNKTSMLFMAFPDGNELECMAYRNPGADLCIRSNELPLEMIRRSKIFHCVSLTLVSEPARSAHYLAVETAKANGALISFDVNHRPGLWTNKKEAHAQIMRMIGLTDVLKVNEHELELLTGSKDPGVGGVDLLKRGVKLVAVTLRNNGTCYLTPESRGCVSQFHVEEVDSTGCGDGFVAGLLSCLIELEKNCFHPDERDLVRSITYANAAGALTALKQGAIPALPTALEVDSFLAGHRLT